MILLNQLPNGKYKIIQGHHRIAAIQVLANQSGKPCLIQAECKGKVIYIHVEPNGQLTYDCN